MQEVAILKAELEKLRKACNELKIEKFQIAQRLDASMAIYADDKSKFMLAIMLKCMRIGVLEEKRAEMPALEEQLRTALASLSACRVDLDGSQRSVLSKQAEMCVLEEQLRAVPAVNESVDLKTSDIDSGVRAEAECRRLDKLWRKLTIENEKLKVKAEGLEQELKLSQQQHMHCAATIQSLRDHIDLSDQLIASQMSVSPAVPLQQPNLPAPTSPGGLGSPNSPYLWWNDPPLFAAVKHEEDGLSDSNELQSVKQSSAAQEKKYLDELVQLRKQLLDSTQALEAAQLTMQTEAAALEQAVISTADTPTTPKALLGQSSSSSRQLVSASSNVADTLPLPRKQQLNMLFEEMDLNGSHFTD